MSIMLGMYNLPPLLVLSTCLNLVPGFCLMWLVHFCFLFTDIEITELAELFGLLSEMHYKDMYVVYVGFPNSLRRLNLSPHPLLNPQVIMQSMPNLKSHQHEVQPHRNQGFSIKQSCFAGGILPQWKDINIVKCRGFNLSPLLEKPLSWYCRYYSFRIQELAHFGARTFMSHLTQSNKLEI